MSLYNKVEICSVKFNSIRVSRSLRDTAYKAIYTKESLTKRMGKEPTVNEIADEIGISKEDVAYAMDAIQSPVSLFEPVYSEGGDTMYVMDQIKLAWPNGIY